MAQNCYLCGKKLEPGQEYCSNCGTRNDISREETVPAPGSYQPSPAPQPASPPPAAPSKAPPTRPIIPPFAGGSGTPPPTYNQAPTPGGVPPYRQPGAPAGSPPGTYPPMAPTQPVKKKSGCVTALVITLVVVAVLAVVGVAIVGIVGYGVYSNSDQEDFIRPFIEDNILPGSGIAEALEKIESHYSQGNNSKALEEALALLSDQESDPSVLVAVGVIMENYGDSKNAAYFYLCAYTSDQGDYYHLEMADHTAAPYAAIDSSATKELLQQVFQKPMNQITWEEIGEVKSFIYGDGYIQMGLADKLEVSQEEYQASLHTYYFEDNDTIAPYFMYNLTHLSITPSLSGPSSLRLAGLRQLRSLHLSSISGDQQLEFLKNGRNIQELTVGGTSIESLAGLEYLDGLRSLSLNRVDLDDLSVLTRFPQLEELHLYRARELADLSFLADIPRLTAFSYHDGDIMDMHFLESCTGLESLSLSGTGIRTVSFLSSLTSLKHLTLYGNSDLLSVAGIGELTQLETLVLSCRNMEGVAELSALTGLQSLTLLSPGDLNMISGMDQLTYLRVIGAANLESIQPMSGLSSLETLILDGYTSYYQGDAPTGTQTVTSTAYYSMTPLTGLSNLRHVKIAGGYFLGDNSALFTKDGLTSLELRNCYINAPAFSFDALVDLEALKLLKCRVVENVQVWQSGFITSLDYDHVESSAITDRLSRLSLSHLEYQNAEIKDLGFVSGMENLAYLDLADNYIEDISPLLDCAALEYVSLVDNPVGNWQVADNLPGVAIAGRP